MLLSLFRDFSLNVEGLLLLLLFNQQNSNRIKILKQIAKMISLAKMERGEGVEMEPNMRKVPPCWAPASLSMTCSRTAIGLYLSSPFTEFNIADKVPALSSQQLCEKGKLNWVMTGPRSTSERLEPGSCHAWSKSNTLTTTPHWSRVF